MNETVNTLLLAGDKFMPEIHLKQLGFTYSASGSFTKNKQRIKKFMEAGNYIIKIINYIYTLYTNYIYKNELDKACF